MLTPEERAEKNRLNAQKSTGPRTEEGKAAARWNSFKHGLTATELGLLIEDPAIIQAEADAWAEAIEPEGFEEEKLVDSLALHTLKLKRANEAETAIVNNQIRFAMTDWDKAQEAVFQKAKELFRKKPGTALIELKRNGLGLAWLIEQWEILNRAFDLHGYWNHVDLIRQALRLSGFNPEKLATEGAHAYEFALLSTHCHPSFPNVPDMKVYLDRNLAAEHFGIYAGQHDVNPARAVATVRHWVDTKLADLKALKTHFDHEEAVARVESETRAFALDPTPRNRLLVRYAASIENGLGKALKALEKLKTERKKEAEKETKTASKPEKRNEAIFRASANTDKVRVGSCIKLKGQPYEVMDTGDGAIYMVPTPLGTPQELMDQDIPDQQVVSVPFSGG